MAERRGQATNGAAPAACELLVIGAGVIGLATAWRAARAGLSVTLVDRDEPGTGTSAVAAGMLAPAGEASWGEEALLRAGLRSAEMYASFAADLTEDSRIDPGYRRCGALHVAADRDEAAELRRRSELHAELGLESEWRDSAECRSLEPALSSRVGPGLHAPGDGEVDTRALLDALLDACRSRGVVVRPRTEISGLIREGERVRGATTTDGEALGADATVVSAGCWSGGEWLGPRAALPVRPVKGELVRLRSLGAPLPCERLIVAERVYLVPRRSGELVVGATTAERGFETAVTAGGVHELLREAYRLVPEIAELELVEAAAGLRPGTPDNLPLVGPTGVRGLLAATGHYRNGILLAPLTAAAIVAEATGAKPPPEVEAMSPRRFERERAKGTVSP